MNRYGKGRFNGPIFKLQAKNFDFDGDKANEEEDFLINKMKEIGVPGSGPVRREFYEKNLFIKQKKPTVENDYLKRSLATNPYYMVNQSEQIIYETTDKTVLQDQLVNLSNTFASGDGEQEDEQAHQQRLKQDCSKDFFDRFDLQSTKVFF